MSYEFLWLEAFALTLAIEVPIYAALLRRCAGSWLAAIALGVVLQVATHPALWFLAPRFEPYWAWVVTMEVLVWLIEGVLAGLAIKHPKGKRYALAYGLFASLCANATSTLIGLALQ